MSTTTSPTLMHSERVRTDQLHGQNVVHMSLPSGDSVTIALHGAQVVSWLTGKGVERLAGQAGDAGEVRFHGADSPADRHFIRQSAWVTRCR